MISKTEAHRDVSPLEINLEGKSLTDDGAEEMSEALVDVLHPANIIFPTRLQSLNMSGNGLTANCLSALASFLHLTADDLEELDLSRNNIDIQAHDLPAWESFLKSLRDCRALKKLNLSDNKIGGLRTLEAFARVYTQQYKRSLGSVRSCEIVGDAAAGVGQLKLADKKPAPVAAASDQNHKGSASTTFASGTHGQKGLPAIHTILLSSASITDGGALFLTYVLEAHSHIQHTLTTSNGDEETSSPVDPSRIIFLPDTTLSVAALKMLTHFDLDVLNPEIGYATPALRNLDTNGAVPRYHASAHGYKKHNAFSTKDHIQQTPKKQNISTEELESMRRKFQRAIIEDSGPTSVVLWHSALRLLGLVRRVMANHEALTQFSPRAKRLSSVDQTSHDVDPVTTHRRASSYASKFMSSSTYDPTPVPDANATSTKIIDPPVLRHPRDYYANVDGITASSATQSSRTGAVTMSNHNPQMIGPLPIRAWAKIFCFLADPSGILSERQRRAVITWGSNRDTLASEAEILGKPASVQIWRVLEGMDCLIYDDISN